MTSTADDDGRSPVGRTAGTGQKTSPTNWWQWFFLYPAFAIALLTALPDWFDRIERLAKETFQSGYVEETELVDFMRKNPECVASPVLWIEATNQTKVDGTICSETGDVWLRILGAGGVAAYKGIDISALLEDLTNTASLRIQLSTAAWANESVWSDPAAATARDRSQWEVAQDFAIVVCQEFSGDRIIRHLRTGDVCFDEIVNSRTGVVISRTQVPCRDSCSSN